MFLQVEQFHTKWGASVKSNIVRARRASTLRCGVIFSNNFWTRPRDTRLKLTCDQHVKQNPLCPKTGGGSISFPALLAQQQDNFVPRAEACLEMSVFAPSSA